MELEKHHLKPIGPCLWEIPASTRKGMLVPARVFARADMLGAMLSDRSLEQLLHVATLPGIQVAAIAMPDAHEGYGFPIGGVAATRYPDGMISPGGIGYDINCGVRLLASPVRWTPELEALMPALTGQLQAQVPSGVGKGGFVVLDGAALEAVLREGAPWAVRQGYGTPQDLAHIEYRGQLPADPAAVSEQARRRGHDQLGTLGSGNHFLEVDRVTEIFDEAAARAFGLEPDQLVVLIHTGSRGLGHQVATDYIRLMQQAMPQYGYQPPDRELAGVPYNSPEGQQYAQAMAAAANFAWCNRQVIAAQVRKAWQAALGEKAGELTTLYDVSHNIARLEEYLVEGQPMKLIVHRKGATRAFGPGSAELPEAYRPVGQPVLIPGSMGTASYVLAGNAQSAELSFGSTCHGAGRRLSRRAVKKQVSAPKIKEDLLREGIHLEAVSFREIAEEAPLAYKDIESVVDTVQEAGIARKVARLRPLIVLKG